MSDFIMARPDIWNRSEFVRKLNETQDDTGWKIYADACFLSTRIDTSGIWVESKSATIQRLNVSSEDYDRIVAETRKRGLFFHNDTFGIWLNYNPKFLEHNPPGSQSYAAKMLKHIMSMPDCEERQMAYEQLREVCRQKIINRKYREVVGKHPAEVAIEDWFESAFGEKVEKPTTPKAKQLTPVQQFIEDWCVWFKDKAGNDYTPTWAKEGKIISELLKTIDMEILRQYAQTFFNVPDAFTATAGYSIAIFKSQINKIAGGQYGSNSKHGKRTIPETTDDYGD